MLTSSMPRQLFFRRAVTMILLLVIGIYIGRYWLPVSTGAVGPLQWMSVKDGQRQLTFPTFWEAWDELHQKYDGELEDKDLFYGAISGMVKAAGDPYTAFATPEETKQFHEVLKGSFSGIGVEIGIRKNLITVIAPLADSPAAKAGVREGDIIAAVDKTPLTQDLSIDQVVSKIRGERGTKVVLTVIHPEAQETTDIEIVRDQIQVESVKLKIEEGIAQITISSFNSDTADRFSAAAEQAAQANVRGVIVDVRNNPGGFLQAAVEIASDFLPKNTVVVSERGGETREFKADGEDILAGIPVVMIVNGGSASASEILAGALHDQVQAPLVGTKTFGKGSVQELIELKDGSSLRVTVAKWFTPQGRNINEAGIEPTVVVEQNFETPEDEQLLKAQEELRRLIEQKT